LRWQQGLFELQKFGFELNFFRQIHTNFFPPSSATKETKFNFRSITFSQSKEQAWVARTGGFALQTSKLREILTKENVQLKG